MGAFDYVLLVLIGTHAVFAARRLRKKSGCRGDCGRCRGCGRPE